MEQWNNDNKCGIWLKTSAKGLNYLSGKITITQPGDFWINIFDNRSKKAQNPKAPDHQLVLKLIDGGGSTHVPTDTEPWQTDQDSPY